MRIDHLRKQSRREKHFHDIGEERDEDGIPLDEENALARLSAVARNPAQQVDYVYLGQIGKLIARLSPEDREAVILVLIKGYKIESEDPDETTAAKLCGVTGRAIRKRLKKAATKLKQFQKES